MAPGKKNLEGTCESPSVILGLSARQLCVFLKEAFFLQAAPRAKLLMWCLMVSTNEVLVGDLLPGLIFCVPIFWCIEE